MVVQPLHGESMVVLNVLSNHAKEDFYLETLAKALGNRTRRLILWLLSDLGEMGLSQLIKTLKLSREKHKPLLHYHLKLLEKAGLIEVSRVEKKGMIVSAKYYRLTSKAKLLLKGLFAEDYEEERRWLPVTYPVNGNSRDNVGKRIFSLITQILHK